MAFFDASQMPVYDKEGPAVDSTQTATWNMANIELSCAAASDQLILKSRTTSTDSHGTLGVNCSDLLCPLHIRLTIHASE
jgi:hypothetical protein